MGGGKSRSQPAPPPDDVEATLLFNAQALFAEYALDRDAYGRVTTYLSLRFGPIATAPTLAAVS